jgi:hypothetical protein
VSSACDIGTGMYNGQSPKWKHTISWPIWRAPPGAALVAQDLLWEHDHQPSALPLLRKIFAYASEADLAAMLDSARPGHYRQMFNLHDEIDWTEHNVDQTQTDSAIESEISARIGQTSGLDPDVVRACFIADLGTTYTGSDMPGRIRQHGGRHTCPVARAWFARIEAARRAYGEALEKMLGNWSEHISKVVQIPNTILLPPLSTMKVQEADAVFYATRLETFQKNVTAGLTPLLKRAAAGFRQPRFTWLRPRLARVLLVAAKLP